MILLKCVVMFSKSKGVRDKLIDLISVILLRGEWDSWTPIIESSAQPISRLFHQRIYKVYISQFRNKFILTFSLVDSVTVSQQSL